MTEQHLTLPKQVNLWFVNGVNVCNSYFQESYFKKSYWASRKKSIVAHVTSQPQSSHHDSIQKSDTEATQRGQRCFLFLEKGLENYRHHKITTIYRLWLPEPAPFVHLTKLLTQLEKVSSHQRLLTRPTSSWVNLQLINWGLHDYAVTASGAEWVACPVT